MFYVRTARAWKLLSIIFGVLTSSTEAAWITTPRQKTNVEGGSQPPFYLHSFLPRRRHDSRFLLQAEPNEVNSNDESEGGKVMEIESLTANQQVELVLFSFLQACLALSKGDTNPLRLFIVAVRASLENHHGSVQKLIQAVDTCPSTTFRPLDDEETNLRATWIEAICLTLADAEVDGMDFVIDDLDSEIMSRYKPVIPDLEALRKSGLGLNSRNFVLGRQDILQLPKCTTNPFLLDQEDEMDEVQVAIVSQTIQVMYNALVVLAEECVDDVPRNNQTSRTKAKGKPGKNIGRGFA